MKHRRSFLTVAQVAGTPLLVLACSSSDGMFSTRAPGATDPVQAPGGGGTSGEGAASPAGAAGGGTAGGAAVPPGETSTAPCSDAADCDDALSCNGAEQCVAGACMPGEPIACGEHRACAEVAGGTCVYEDRSPWIVYRADDETPALIEEYAVKRDLVGVMEPIKISRGVMPPARLNHETWASDEKLLSFLVVQGETARATIQFVYFGDGGPEHVAEIPGDSVTWSPSGHAFLIRGAEGWSIYEYAGEGQLREVFSQPNDVGFFGRWATDNELVFTTMNEATGLRSLQRAYYYDSEWRTAVLLEDLDLLNFELSPILGELVYNLRQEDGSRGPLYVFQWRIGTPPLAITEAEDVMWSRDGSEYLMTKRGDVDRRGQAFWGTGNVHDRAFVRIAESLDLYWAAFTTEGDQVLLWEDIDDGRRDVRLLNPRRSTEYPWDTVTRMGERDSIYTTEFPSDLVITTAREEVGNSATLRAHFLTTRREYDLDTAAADEAFRYVKISAGGSFVAYQKGKDPDYQAAYVDLRYRENWGYRPVRIGGTDGRVNTFSFDTAGTGLYYIYERTNGARECYYVNLAHQVPGEPVKVSRQGRVEGCQPQP
jgi:hypothetical protein